jgi:hypothetical protein
LVSAGELWGLWQSRVEREEPMSDNLQLDAISNPWDLHDVDVSHTDVSNAEVLERGLVDSSRTSFNVSFFTRPL